MKQNNTEVSKKKKEIKLQKNWVYEGNKLKKRYGVIEKQLQSIYRDGNPLSLEFKDIFDWKQLMHTNRIKQRKELQKHLSQTSNLINKFQINLKQNPSKTQFSEEMTVIAEEIEDKLMRFKTNHQKQMKELQSAENILGKELLVTTERLDTFQNQIISKSTNATNTTEIIAQTNNINKLRTFKQIKNGNCAESDSRPPKLIEIQREIDEQPRNGGWPQRDQNDFLKLYSQIASDKELLHALSEVMPQYTLSELRMHLSWFDTYERLWEYKREIIKEWKEQRLKQKQIKHEIESNSEQIRIQKQKHKQRQIKLAQTQKRQRVKEWREQKEREICEINEQKCEMSKQRNAKQKRQMKQRMKAQKRLLLQLSERKVLNELVSKHKQSQNRNLTKIQNLERNRKLLLKFQTKDMLLVSKKKEAIHKRVKEEQNRQWRMLNLIAQSQPQINFDDENGKKSDLCKMTTSVQKRIELTANERKKKKQNSKTKNRNLFGCATQNSVRSVPSWRKGL